MCIGKWKLVVVCLAAGHVASQPWLKSGGSSDSVKVKWIGDKPVLNPGTTFGLPWPRGRHAANETSFSASAGNAAVKIQSWVTSYWPDGSIKWTGHAVEPSTDVPDEYVIVTSSSCQKTAKRASEDVSVRSDGDTITVDTGKVSVVFAKAGNILVKSISTGGKIVGQNGVLVLRTQTDTDDGSDIPRIFDRLQFEASIDETKVENQGSVRALVTVKGKHTVKQSNTGQDPWLPFTVRFYLYSGSEAIRVVHSLVYDGKPDKDFITAIGLRFDVPLGDEQLYNRHIRIAGVDGGFLTESVQGITGLRRDPGAGVRKAQIGGKTLPDVATWDRNFTTRLQWIPAFNDYSLSQLSPDGFTLKKRTKAGQSWINIPAGNRSSGLAYLGGSTNGGLAIGLRDFWKKYPTGFSISNAASRTVSTTTLWLYSPEAPPMDLRPWHDEMGQDTYAKQLEALDTTYEDYEPGFMTPYGVARTSEVYIIGFPSTPSAETLGKWTKIIEEPPALATEPEVLYKSKAAGVLWAPRTETSGSAATLESHLDFLAKFYRDQVENRRWYGFWDHGDFMHTYDASRHTWAYDVGGYAWDNGELSPDLFFWPQFLRTGDASVYRFAEAVARHGSEVDQYHVGPWKGLGARHGVQHWGDSAKQVRISTPIFRKVFYYLTGGDERQGEIIREVLDADQAILQVDPRRKVRDPNITYVPDPEALYISLGTDWSGLAAALLIEWETRGPRWEEARSKLISSMRGLNALKNGFITGEVFYNSKTGLISPPPDDPDNKGSVTISHLSASFGESEVVTELINHIGANDTDASTFEKNWLDYCYYYGASKADQAARYGTSFSGISLRQGHSKLTALAANRDGGNATIAARAWKEFFSTDGLAPTAPWVSVPISGENHSIVLVPVEEASWISTNEAAQYGGAVIENMYLLGSPP